MSKTYSLSLEFKVSTGFFCFSFLLILHIMLGEISQIIPNIKLVTARTFGIRIAIRINSIPKMIFAGMFL